MQQAAALEETQSDASKGAKQRDNVSDRSVMTARRFCKMLYHLVGAATCRPPCGTMPLPAVRPQLDSWQLDSQAIGAGNTALCPAANTIALALFGRARIHPCRNGMDPHARHACMRALRPRRNRIRPALRGRLRAAPTMHTETAASGFARAADRRTDDLHGYTTVPPCLRQGVCLCTNCVYSASVSSGLSMRTCRSANR